MKRWFAYQVCTDGTHCLGEVWAEDSAAAYERALVAFRCRIDYVSRCG